MRLLLTILLIFGVALEQGASAQTYPTRTVRIVTGGAGGGSDLTVRLIAQGLSATFGQQVIIDNRSGASGALAVQAVQKSGPDGYTLLYYNGSLWLASLLQSVPWDPLKDFEPVSLTANIPNYLVVHPSLPVSTVPELIALARKRPGELNYGSAVTGSSGHLAAELFKFMSGTNIVRVPFKGTAPAMNALIGGEVQMMFAVASAAIPHVKTGRLKGLGVTSPRPTALVPGVPTLSASGLPGFESSAVFALFAPAGTPAPLVQRLSAEITAILKRPDVQEKFAGAGIEPEGSTPDELSATIRRDLARMQKVIAAAGIRVEQ